MKDIFPLQFYRDFLDYVCTILLFNIIIIISK